MGYIPSAKGIYPIFLYLTPGDSGEIKTHNSYHFVTGL